MMMHNPPHPGEVVKDILIKMAIRLSIALNTSSEMWLTLQTNYELWKAEQNRKKILRQVSPIKKFAGRNN